MRSHRRGALQSGRSRIHIVLRVCVGVCEVGGYKCFVRYIMVYHAYALFYITVCEGGAHAWCATIWYITYTHCSVSLCLCVGVCLVAGTQVWCVTVLYIMYTHCSISPCVKVRDTGVHTFGVLQYGISRVHTVLYQCVIGGAQARCITVWYIMYTHSSVSSCVVEGRCTLGALQYGISRLHTLLYY